MGGVFYGSLSLSPLFDTSSLSFIPLVNVVAGDEFGSGLFLVSSTGSFHGTCFNLTGCGNAHLTEPGVFFPSVGLLITGCFILFIDARFVFSASCGFDLGA